MQKKKMKPSFAKNKCLWKQYAHRDEQKGAVMSLGSCAYPLLPFLFLSPTFFLRPSLTSSPLFWNGEFRLRSDLEEKALEDNGEMQM